MNHFDCDIRIRYQETDQMGVCYYSNYLVWFEVARNEFFRALSLPYTQFEQQGIYLPVGEAYCRYQKPLTYDDLIVVRTWISSLKRSSIRFSYRIFLKGNEATTIAEGYTTHVFVDKEMKPCRIPDAIKQAVTVVEHEA